MACKLTSELAERAIEIAESGAFKSTVADAIGVSEACLDELIRMGLISDAPEPYKSFAADFLATEAGLEIDVLKATKLAMQVDPRVGFDFLARRFPKKWGPKATQTGSVSELRPSALEESEQMDLLRNLFKTPPPELVALLEETGFTRAASAAPKSLPESSPPKPLKKR